MQFFVSFMMGTLLLIQTTGAIAAERPEDEDSFTFMAVPDSNNWIKGKVTLAKAAFSEGAAPWLPHVLGILKKNRPPTFQLEQVGIFQGQRDEKYLALNWHQGKSAQQSRIEFHKIETVDGRVRLKFLRRISPFDHVSLHNPSGQVVFPNEPTIAVISHGGGSLYLNYGLRMIQMKRNTVEITPDWAGRIVDVVDLDKDGVHEVVAMDDRWSHFFSGCGGCGPSVPIVLIRKSGQFHPACKAFKSHYIADIRSTLQFVDKSRREQQHGKGIYVSLYQSLAPNVLSYIQIGAFTAAKKTLGDLVIAAKEEGNPTHGERAARVFGSLIDKAKENKDYSCVLSATNATPLHDGAIKRIEHFRFAKNPSSTK